MLSFQAAPSHARETSEAPRISLAVAGGGPIGGTYEFGVPRAFDEALVGLDFTCLDRYVGVDSGAFLAAGPTIRNGTDEMCWIYTAGVSDDVQSQPESFTKPALLVYLERTISLPRAARE